jgi:hypothetical protein
MASTKTVKERDLGTLLDAGPVICAESYLFELERRGYVQAGPFVPTVVLDHPQEVRQLHIDFARAGSDVMLAFTYYGHRAKLRVIGQEELLEPLNRRALEIAKEVAEEAGTLFAGGICNTNARLRPHRISRGRGRRTCRRLAQDVLGSAQEIPRISAPSIAPGSAPQEQAFGAHRADIL